MAGMRLEEYFSLTAMRQGLRVLTWEEFTAPGMPGAKLGAFKHNENGHQSIWDIAYVIDGQDLGGQRWDIGHNMWCHPECPSPGSPDYERFVNFQVGNKGHRKEPVAFTRTKKQHIKEHNVHQNAEEAKIVHIGWQILFGNFYSVLWVRDKELYEQLRWTIRGCIRFRDEFHLKAAEVVKRLGGMGNYNAIHLRRDDWWQLVGKIDFNPTALAARAREMPHKDIMYMAVKFKTQHVQFGDQGIDQREIFEEREKPQLLTATQSKLITSEDFLCSANPKGCTSKSRDNTKEFVKPPPLVTSCVDWPAVVEMLVCAQAANFMGSAKSTFTNGIQRLHGFYHQVAPEIIPPNRLYYHDLPKRDWWLDPTQTMDVPNWKDTNDVSEITWSHEWPEAWLGELPDQRS